MRISITQKHNTRVNICSVEVLVCIKSIHAFWWLNSWHYKRGTRQLDMVPSIAGHFLTNQTFHKFSLLSVLGLELHKYQTACKLFNSKFYLSKNLYNVRYFVSIMWRTLIFSGLILLQKFSFSNFLYGYLRFQQLVSSRLYHL